LAHGGGGGCHHIKGRGKCPGRENYQRDMSQGGMSGSPREKMEGLRRGKEKGEEEERNVPI